MITTRKFIVILFLIIPLSVCNAKDSTATRIGVSYIGGQWISPNNDSYVNAINLSYLSPYTIFLKKPAPEYIRLRTEATLAKVSKPIDGVYFSMAIMAVRYLNKTPESTWRPYIEGGIGLAYASYKVEGQAYNVNFNPQFGIGIDYKTSAGNIWFGGARLSHFSNGSTNSDNTGINSINLSIGRYF